MPLFEFACLKCGSRFEVLVRRGGEEGVRCPTCGGRDVRKLVSSFGIGGGGSRLKTSSASCTTCTSKSCATCR